MNPAFRTVWDWSWVILLGIRMSNHYLVYVCCALSKANILISKGAWFYQLCVKTTSQCIDDLCTFSRSSQNSRLPGFSPAPTHNRKDGKQQVFRPRLPWGRGSGHPQIYSRIGKVNQIPASTINTFTLQPVYLGNYVRMVFAKLEQKPSYILEMGKGRALGNQLREGAPEGKPAYESKNVQGSEKRQVEIFLCSFPGFL